MVIQGFTALVHQEVIDNNEKSTDEKKPLEVLEMEFKIMTRILNPKSLQAVRNLLFWVEWDDAEGRQHNAVAVYYGGHQLAMLREGKHPLKANNITILRMKSLTAEHQPKRDSGRCVLLHEVAHAVQFQLLGKDNPRIKAAYNQALERKLVDKNSYAGSSDAEFFAEMSCAYLDKLHYYPHSRDDLRKHDDYTYRLMEATWGKAATSTAAKDPDPRANTEYELDLNYTKVRFPEPLRGPRLEAESLKGKVFLYVYWTPEVTAALTILSKLQSWHEELNDFGLVVAVTSVKEGSQQQAEEAAKERKTSFTLLEKTFLTGKHEFRMPHGVLFDEEGKCIYRGLPLACETQVRASLARILLRSIGKEEFADPVKPAVEALKKGETLSAVIARLTALKVEDDEAAAKDVRLLLEPLTRHAKKLVARAEEVMKDEPLTAFLLLEQVPVRFKGTPEATRATQLMQSLRTQKPVPKELSKELGARTVLAKMRTLDTQLSARPGSDNPTSVGFIQSNLPTLRQLEYEAKRLKQFCEGAPSAEIGLKIASKYGISIP